MKKCSKCKVEVNTIRKTCPLCGQFLENPDKEEFTQIYPTYVNEAKKIDLFLRILLFISVTVMATVLLINFLTYDGVSWSLYVVIGVVYAWILWRSTIKSKRNVASRLLVQMIALSLTVYGIEEISNTGNWALDYIIPFICVATTLSIVILIFSKKMLYSDYLFYLLLSIIIGFVPLILYLTQIINVLWPSITAAGVSSITTLGMIIFADRATKDELKRRFHL
ncbi:MAG: DUF6320 domain-containing protein [Bacilli bacterium]